MAKMEGTYIQVAYKNVFGYISTNSWPLFMIQRPTIREKCAWVRSNTWRDERPVATGLDRFFSVFRFFNKHRNWQPKKFRICATATSGPAGSYPAVVLGFTKKTSFIRVIWLRIISRFLMTNTIIDPITFFKEPNSYFFEPLHDGWHFTNVNNQPPSAKAPMVLPF